MGKYLPKKPKTTLKEVVSSTTTTTTTAGVRTRAKTLALQSTNPDANSLCYLQLRSRRLQKPLFFNKTQRPQKQTHKEEENKGQFGKTGEIETGGSFDEASCGEKNNLEFVNRDRSTTESIPCSLVRDLDNIVTPGSTPRNTSSAVNDQNDTQICSPTPLELDEFFSNAEQEQQRLFIDKYNFDIVNDLPLPGRYEWAKLSPSFYLGFGF
jgi:hypothetical protein